MRAAFAMNLSALAALEPRIDRVLCIAARRCPDVTLEGAREVRLVVESDVDGHVGGWLTLKESLAG